MIIGQKLTEMYMLCGLDFPMLIWLITTQTNTWFMQDGAFLRMKTAEIGYSLSDKLVD